MRCFAILGINFLSLISSAKALPTPEPDLHTATQLASNQSLFHLSSRDTIVPRAGDDRVVWHWTVKHHQAIHWSMKVPVLHPRRRYAYTVVADAAIEELHTRDFYTAALDRSEPELTTATLELRKRSTNTMFFVVKFRVPDTSGEVTLWEKDDEGETSGLLGFGEGGSEQWPDLEDSPSPASPDSPARSSQDLSGFHRKV